MTARSRTNSTNPSFDASSADVPAAAPQASTHRMRTLLCALIAGFCALALALGALGCSGGSTESEGQGNGDPAASEQGTAGDTDDEAAAASAGDPSPTSDASAAAEEPAEETFEPQGGALEGKNVNLGWDTTVPVKVGGYYFTSGNDGLLQYSAKKKGSYTQTAMEVDKTIVSGRTCFYTREVPGQKKVQLRAYDLATGEDTLINRLSGEALSCGALYDIYLYVNFQTERGDVYVRTYNLYTGELGAKIKNVRIEAAGGEYVAYTTCLRTDVSPTALYLARLRADGALADKQRVAKLAYDCSFVGSTLWFCSYNSATMGDTMYVKTAQTKNGLPAKVATKHSYSSENGEMMTASRFNKDTFVLTVDRGGQLESTLMNAKTGEDIRQLVY